MRDPKPPPPPPPPPAPWSEEAPSVSHLSGESFAAAVESTPHTLVMFYAPWCGHCKAAKPEFVEATKAFSAESGVVFAGVDCTDSESGSQALCQDFDVKGYPTIKYFAAGASAPTDYSGGRKAPDFVTFMSEKAGIAAADGAEPAAEE